MTRAVSELKSLPAIQEAAADWCARRIDGGLSPEEKAKLNIWLSADPRHIREYEAMRSLWSDAAEVAERPAIESLRTGLREDWPVVESARSASKLAARHRWSHRWPMTLAAGLAVAAIAVAWVMTSAPEPVYVTERGEQREITLDDGTLVELDADTELTLAYGDEERRVILEAGQAHFDVHRDENRPFIVVAGDSEIRALGTSFQVYRRPGTVTVTLLEGRVEVVPANDRPNVGAAEEPAWKEELEPGEQLTLAIEQPVTPEVTSVDVDRVTAWQRGMMDFDGLTLPQVVAELNRYSDTPVLIADSSLNDTRVSGVFAIGDTETLLLALETGFGIDARPRPASGDIALYRADSD